MDGLPRSAPEAQGIASSSIRAWVDAALAGGSELHGVMVVRHAHVIAEGWWAPYRDDAVHLLYSLSKSFTATAVGLAIGEGLLDLDDRIVDLFPDRLPGMVGDNLVALRVRHLLTMAAGHEIDSTSTMTMEDDWVAAYLAHPFPLEPGTRFVYDSGTTFLLSAIVQKVAGATVLEYLRPRVLEPLGIDRISWETSPDGVNVGGWGMSTTTEAVAKFGQLYLAHGVWDGRQLLPRDWVIEATRHHIQQPADFMTAEWQQGYGYQFWRCRHGAYRADGAFGQYCIVLPEQDAVIAITSRSPDMQGLLDTVWDVLLPAMTDAPLPADDSSAGALARELRSEIDRKSVV